MKMALEHKTEKGFRAALPFISTFVLILLMQVQYRVAFLDNLFPFLSLLAVYYWCIYKPQLMPVSMVFILGLLQDLLSGGPLGMMALALILVRTLVMGQGRQLPERGFLFNWLVFFIFALLFGLTTWTIASIYLKETQNLWNVLGQSMLTIAIFPVIFWLLSRLNHRLLAENR